MGLDQYLLQDQGGTELERVGYWRKANMIHRWFCQHVNGGEDINCGEKEVAPELILALRQTCREILADHSKAVELMPTEEGFFFGSTDYGEGYFEDLIDTDKILSELNLEAGKVFYDAWW